MTTTRTPSARITLDRHWNVVERSAGAAPWPAAAGRNVWESPTPAEPIFRPIAEAAWERGEEQRRAFFNGTLFDVEARVAADRLVLTFDVADQLDAITLDSLAASLRRMLQATEGQTAPATPPPAPPRLRLVDEEG